jgi:hypothetical protein
MPSTTQSDHERHTYLRPCVVALPRPLEPVTPDTFGGLVDGSSTTHPRRGLT